MPRYQYPPIGPPLSIGHVNAARVNTADLTGIDINDPHLARYEQTITADCVDDRHTLSRGRSHWHPYLVLRPIDQPTLASLYIKDVHARAVPQTFPWPRRNNGSDRIVPAPHRFPYIAIRL
jgi:hypothetical protein